jgi:hypothetical protein
MKLHILYESARIKDAKNALKEFDKAFDKFFPKFDTNEMEAYPEEFLCDEESGVFYLSYFVDQEQHVFKIHGKDVSKIGQANVPDTVKDYSDLLSV